MCAHTMVLVCIKEEKREKASRELLSIRIVCIHKGTHKLKNHQEIVLFARQILNKHTVF